MQTLAPLKQSHLVQLYGGTNGSRDIAREAYDATIKDLKSVFARDKKALEWLNTITSMKEVAATVSQAEEKYKAPGKRKTVQKWLRKLSSVILFYSRVFDVLAQHHPELVSLVWGAVKFILIGIVNHGELVEEFSKAVADIWEALPTAEVNAKLYQTDMMLEAVSNLYRHILLFLRQALRWYQSSPAYGVFSAIFKPFKLQHQDTMDEVKRCTVVIESVAGSSMRAELRDMHVLLQMVTQRLTNMETRMDSTLDHVSQTLQLATTNKSISESIQVEICDLRPHILDTHYGQVMNLLKPRILPVDSLRKHESLVSRVQHWPNQSHDMLIIVEKIRSWVLAPQSSLLILQTVSRGEIKVKEITTQLIKLLHPSTKPIAWYLSETGSKSDNTNISDVFRSLVYQLLQFDSVGLQHNFNENLTAGKLHGIHTEQEWIDLLAYILKCMSECYIVVEAEDVFKLLKPKKRACEAKRFLESFQQLVNKVSETNCRIKVMVVSYGTSAGVLEKTRSSSISETQVVTVQPSLPVPPRLRKINTRSAFRSPAWHGLKRKFTSGSSNTGGKQKRCQKRRKQAHRLI